MSLRHIPFILGMTEGKGYQAMHAQFVSKENIHQLYIYFLKNIIA